MSSLNFSKIFNTQTDLQFFTNCLSEENVVFSFTANRAQVVNDESSSSFTSPDLEKVEITVSVIKEEIIDDAEESYDNFKEKLGISNEPDCSFEYTPKIGLKKKLLFQKRRKLNNNFAKSVDTKKRRKFVKNVPSFSTKFSYLDDEFFSSIVNNADAYYDDLLKGCKKDQEFYPTVRAVNSKKIRCNLCKLAFGGHNVKKQQSHAISHLKSESRVEWLFRCLLCTKKSFFKENIHAHLRIFHEIPDESLAVDQHYEDRSSLYSVEIDRIKRLAFPVKSAKRNLSCEAAGSNKNVTDNRADCIESSASTSHMKNPRNDNIEHKQSKIPLIVCSLCKLKMPDVLSTKYSHAVSHMKTESSVQWLYKCLLCSDTAWNRQKMFFHSLKVHGLTQNKLEAGVHFEDKTSLHAEEINRIVQLAFPETTLPLLSTPVTNKPPQKLVENVSLVSNRLQCKLCDEIVAYTRLDGHVLKHLQTEAGISWVYKCLLCDKLKTIHRSAIRKHVKFVHKDESHLQEGVHFACRKSQCKDELVRIRQLAFPELTNSKIPAPDSTVEENDGKFSTRKTQPWKKRRQCQLCKKHVTSSSKHHVTHLPELAGINWLFTCLLCDDFKTLHHNRSIASHVAFVHNVKHDQVRAGVHYANLRSKYSREISQVHAAAFPRKKTG